MIDSICMTFTVVYLAEIRTAVTYQEATRSVASIVLSNEQPNQKQEITTFFLLVTNTIPNTTLSRISKTALIVLLWA